MQIVHVLRNEQELPCMRRQLHNRLMRRVRFALANTLTALAIPFPNEIRIFRESFRCCQFGRIEISPVAVLPTKCRDSAFGGDARACDYQDSHNSSSDSWVDRGVPCSMFQGGKAAFVW